MDMDNTIGVVPSQDDLEWVWEDIQDGVLLQDLLLSSVLPSLQKPSAVFVETHANVNNNGYEYDDDMTMDMNEWYANSEYNNFTMINPTPMETILNVPVATELNLDTTQHGYDNYFYQNYVEPKNEETAMDFAEVVVYPPVNINTTAPSFLPEQEVNAYLNLTETPEVEHPETYGSRSGVSSVYSNSSWDTFADDSSHTSELSQEEIYEEIQRECAEIERRSTSPALKKSSIRKKQSRSRRKLDAEERKKELNRVAAAKYREKKRIEREQKNGELQQLEIRNRKLKSQAGSLENEIKYLKELIHEIRARREAL